MVELSSLDIALAELEKEETEKVSLLTDTPLAIVGGFQDAVKATANFAGDLVYKGMTGEEYEGDITEDIIPKGYEPKRLPGQIIKPITQFAAGFTGVGVAGKAANLTKLTKFAPKLAQKATPFLKGFAGEMIAFDKHEKNLTDMLNDSELKDIAVVKAMNEYLGHTEQDTMVEARFKNALEGSFTGAAADAMFKGVKYIKDGRTFKDLSSKSKEAIVNSSAGIRKIIKTIRSLSKGSNVEDVIKAEKEKIKFSPREKEAITIEQQEINAQRYFSRISGEDINSPAVKKAFKKLKETEEGKKLTAITLYERQAYTQGKEGVRGALDKFHSSGKAEDLEEGMNIVYNLMELDNAAKDTFSETSRALGFRGKESAVVDINRIKQIFDNAGKFSKKEILEAINLIDDQDAFYKMMNNIVNDTRTTKPQAWYQVIKTYHANALLSSPKTMLGDTFATQGFQWLRIGERYTAAMISKIRKGLPFKTKKDFVDFSEGNAMLQKQLDLHVDVIRAIAKGVQEGYQSKSLSKAFASANTDIKRLGADIGDRWGANLQEGNKHLNPESLGLNPDGALWKGIEFFKKMPSPLQVLEYKDQVIAYATYHGEMKARAIRYVNKMINSGEFVFKNNAEKQAKINYFIENASRLPKEGESLIGEIGHYDFSVSKSLADDALAKTKEALFRDESGKLTKSAQNLVNNTPFGFLIVPFVKTPVKIKVERFFKERSLGAFISPSFYKKLKSGGAEADIALAQLGLGLTFQTVGLYLAINGITTGTSPSEKARRDTYLAAGLRPNSIIVNGTSIDLSRYEPIASFLTYPASLVSTFNSQLDRLDDDDKESLLELMFIGAVGTATTLTDSVWLRNLSDTVELLTTEGTPPERLIKQFENMATGFVPAILSDPKDMFDWQEYQQQAFGLFEKIKAKIGADTRPALDIFGMPIKRAENWYGALPSLNSETKLKDPVLKAMINNSVFFAKPDNTFQFMGGKTRLTPDEHYALMEEIGKAGTYKALERFVKSNMYLKGDKVGRGIALDELYRGKVEQAKANFINNNPQVKQRLIKEQTERLTVPKTPYAATRLFIGE